MKKLKLSRNEILMLILIAAAIIGIATRWPYVREEISNSFRERFSTEESSPKE